MWVVDSISKIQVSMFLSTEKTPGLYTVIFVSNKSGHTWYSGSHSHGLLKNGLTSGERLKKRKFKIGRKTTSTSVDGRQTERHSALRD